MKIKFHAFNYSIKNASDDSADIYIDGAIVDAETQQIYRDWFGDDTSVSFKSFREDINALGAKTINIYINSGGGVVTDAMAIHDMIIDMQKAGKTVNTIGRGIVASAATYILMASKNASLSKNSWFMIHNVSGGVYGDVNDVENYAVTLRKFNDMARDFYSNATGIRKEDVTKMMNSETWLTADDAKAKGFIKNVTSEATFTNSISKEHWQFSNMAVLNSYNASVKTEENTSIQNFDEMKKFFENFAADIKKAINGIKKPENSEAIDHDSFVNAVAEAVSKPFESVGEQMENAVNEAVKNATKENTDKITNLETANQAAEQKIKDLETEITNLKGKATNSKDGNEGVKAIGSFSK